jgi:hypothetical protein
VRGSEERLYDLTLGVQIAVRDGALSLYAPACPARQLARRLRGAVDDRRDRVEGHGEDVVQHECEPLGRRKRLQDDEQRQTDRVGQQRLVLRVHAVRAIHDRLGQANVDRRRVVEIDPRNPADVTNGEYDVRLRCRGERCDRHGLVPPRPAPAR